VIPHKIANLVPPILDMPSIQNEDIGSQALSTSLVNGNVTVRLPSVFSSALPGAMAGYSRNKLTTVAGNLLGRFIVLLQAQ